MPEISSGVDVVEKLELLERSPEGRSGLHGAYAPTMLQLQPSGRQELFAGCGIGG